MKRKIQIIAIVIILSTIVIYKRHWFWSKYFDYRISMASSSECAAIMEKLAALDLMRIIENPVLSKKTRGMAADALRIYKKTESTNYFVGGLNSLDEYVRWTSVNELRILADKTSLSALLGYTKKEENPLFRAAGIGAIAKMEVWSNETFTIFEEALKDPFWEVRIAGISGFARAKTGPLKMRVEKIIDMLKDKNRSVQDHASDY